jgi:DNA-binding NarL/FixJ family response regulator
MSCPPLVRVLLVDDFDAFRSFIRTTLQGTQFQIIAEVPDGLEGIQKAEELQPDLILLDIGLPNLNGIEAARRIPKRAPRSKILFLSQESFIRCGRRSSQVRDRLRGKDTRWRRTAGDH